MTFINLLAILFIGLKLAAIIDWSWWLVLITVYPYLIALVLVLLGSIVLLFEK